ncbi:hypothetical protein GGD66_006960 [Bradyrhizobium sp. CIR48]|nr:hypothetical protein [Bradyrhizobium sp. CIR48]MBB4428373.1 hypothetical protein [Bradyrhizobium sp. CIR48]
MPNEFKALLIEEARLRNRAVGTIREAASKIVNRILLTLAFVRQRLEMA